MPVNKCRVPGQLGQRLPVNKLPGSFFSFSSLRKELEARAQEGGDPRDPGLYCEM